MIGSRVIGPQVGGAFKNPEGIVDLRLVLAGDDISEDHQQLVAALADLRLLVAESDAGSSPRFQSSLAAALGEDARERLRQLCE